MGVIWANQRTARFKQSFGTKAPLDDKLRKLGVFLSHAKKDGQGAALLLQRFRDLAPKRDEIGVNSIEMFFDAHDTIAGDSYSEQFEQAIKSGALLGIVTDAYHGRPWCMWELLTAKKYASPIVLWDLSNKGTLRSFPYLGNVPVVRTSGAKYSTGETNVLEQLVLESISDAEVERVLLALLSEALRMEVWAANAEALVRRRKMMETTIVFARPPELAEITQQCKPDTKIVVYPDPPICLHERALLTTAFPQLAFISLGELTI